MASQILNKLSKAHNLDRFKSVLITQICGIKRKPQIKDQYCYPNRDPNYIQKGKILIFQNPIRY